jgi:hypothetical protein
MIRITQVRMLHLVQPNTAFTLIRSGILLKQVQAGRGVRVDNESAGVDCE